MTQRNPGTWRGQQIYAVYATDNDRNRLLDFAIGAKEDIEAYFDDRKSYGLVLEPVNPLIIEAGYLVKRDAILKEKKQLEERLSVLNLRLKRFHDGSTVDD